MKKWLTAILTVVLIFCLSACQFGVGSLEDLDSILGSDEDVTIGDQDQNETETTQEQSRETETVQTKPASDEAEYTSYQLTEVGTIMDSDRTMTVRYEGLLLPDGTNAKLLNYMGQDSDAGTISGLEYLGNGVYAVSNTSGDVNAVGLVDQQGEMLIPFESCKIDWPYDSALETDRYLLVTYALEVTQNQDECFIYMTDSMFSLSPDEDDVMYTGYARIYDVQEKGFVGDVKITNAYKYAMQPCGNNFLVTDEEGITILYNAKGEDIFQTSHNVDVGNGIFVVQDSGTYRVYDSNGNQTFTYNKGLYILEGNSGYLYNYEDGKYTIMDRNGNSLPDMNYEQILSERDGVFKVKSGDKYGLVKADGTVILSCDIYDYVYEIGAGYYYGSYINEAGETVYGLIGAEGVIADGMTNDVSTLTDMKDENAFVIENGDYTLALETAYPKELANGLISAQADSTGLYGVFDLISGQRLLAYDYETVEYAAGYLYAFKDGKWTVYQVNGPDFK